MPLWGFSSKPFASLVAKSSLFGFANPNGVDIAGFMRIGGQTACGEVDAKEIQNSSRGPSPHASSQAVGLLRPERKGLLAVTSFK